MTIPRLGARHRTHHVRAALLAVPVLALATLAPAQPAVTAGLPSLRLVDPVLTSANSYDFTFDAVRNDGKGWGDLYYTPGLKVYYFFRNVGDTFSLTFEAKDSTGQPWPDKSVFLIVNKYRSCSEATFTSPVETLFDPAGHHDPHVIQGDWCGDDGNGTSPQAGETAIPGVTDSNGRVSFQLTNTNSASIAEPAPIGLNVPNSYTNPLHCDLDPRCLMSTITASFTQRPGLVPPGGTLPANKTEDRDLLWIHFVNNGIAAEAESTTKELADRTHTLRFRVTDLSKSGKASSAVTFTQSSGPDASYITDSAGNSNLDGTVSATTDADGWASVVFHADPAVPGSQVVTAKIDGTPSSTRASVLWVEKIAPPVLKPAFTRAASISGTAKVGKQLKAAAGTWSGQPSLSYAWLACSATGKSSAAPPKGCAYIKSATKSYLTLGNGLRGKYIRVRVAAKNSAGVAYSFSATTAKVG